MPVPVISDSFPPGLRPQARFGAQPAKLALGAEMKLRALPRQWVFSHPEMDLPFLSGKSIYFCILLFVENAVQYTIIILWTGVIC